MNQNYYNNNMDVPKVVDNIMTNLDTYSNNNSNNYVPINNLTYNPNSFDPYGQSDISSLGNNSMGINNMGMNNMGMNNMGTNNMGMNNMGMNNMGMNNMGMNNMGMNNMGMNNMGMNEKHINQDLLNNRMLNHQMLNAQNPNYNKKSKKVIKSIENFKNLESKKIFSFNSLKSIVICTILFVIFSHSKMTDIICKFIPDTVTMVSNIPCILLKGFIMSIIIFLLDNFNFIL
jgi:hypothetical protein